MNMHTISNNAKAAVSAKTSSNMNLRSGQMIAGKVIELYPNQKAKIQIGGMQVVAQLETALSAKQGYIFRVVSNTNTLHLKKVSNAAIESSQSLDRLLEQLGISSTKNNQQLFSELISKNIPFSRNDAKLITQLLEKFGSNPLNRELLVAMAEKKFPLTEQVFQALQGIAKQNVGNDMKNLMSQLLTFINQSSNSTKTPISQMLISHLNQFLGVSANNGPVPLLTSENSRILFQMLQRTGNIHSEMPLSKFQTLVQQMTHSQTANMQLNTAIETNNQQLLQNQIIQQARPVIQQLLPLFSQNDAELLQNSMQNSQTLKNNSRQVANILMKTNWESANLLTPVNKAYIQQFTSQVLQSHLQTNVKEMLQKQITFNQNEIKNLDMMIRKLNNPAPLNQGMQEIKNILAHSEIVTKSVNSMTKADLEVLQRWIQNSDSTSSQNQQIGEILKKIKLNILSPSELNIAREFILKTDQIIPDQPQSVRDHFLTLIKQFINTSGIQDEVQLLQGSAEQDSFSLKQLLLLSSQSQAPELAGDRMMRLLQTLTGMQLQMLNQDQSLTQINLQVPGHKFNLAEDIRIQFEGKKKEGAKEIDPDFCRVLFHLNLNNIGETIIAMSIQKRVVHLAVYNDQEEVKPVLSLFKPLFKEKLAEVNYQLTSISWKKLKDINGGKSNAIQTNPYEKRTAEGIDFRI
ncbi:hypothetical protein F9U64_03645 [Gracilibacillus oryzae]|uniref:Flagellar hook-length control protein-like C-terminal domain-containing protein n=1 Tax=Gracilibacillus oryzae TaxID=1672701 RepID=A0A7C8GUU9_9BACI|nr:hypothetical protein [Gracilibacillus oryzae]KAB8138721.1 hypothetical protein F9U64_03645 [Gracilibacillus oryzae]